MLAEADAAVMPSRFDASLMVVAGRANNESASLMSSADERAVAVEGRAHGEQRSRKQLVANEEQQDEQPPDAPVAVAERMDGLELVVRDGRANEVRQIGAILVDEPLEV